MEQPKGPTPDHLQRVINRMSAQYGAIVVENTSLSEMLIEKDREIMALKNEIADLKDGPDGNAEPVTNEEVEQIA